MLDGRLLLSLLAGVKDTDWTQKLVQVAWCRVVLPLTEEIQINCCAFEWNSNLYSVCRGCVFILAFNFHKANNNNVFIYKVKTSNQTTVQSAVQHNENNRITVKHSNKTLWLT